MHSCSVQGGPGTPLSWSLSSNLEARVLSPGIFTAQRVSPKGTTVCEELCAQVPRQDCPRPGLMFFLAGVGP